MRRQLARNRVFDKEIGRILRLSREALEQEAVELAMQAMGDYSDTVEEIDASHFWGSCTDQQKQDLLHEFRRVLG